MATQTQEFDDSTVVSGALNAIDAALGVLQWTRAKLVEKEEENRKLKRIIMELTESSHADS